MNLQRPAASRTVLLASHHANHRGSAISLVELGIRLPQHGFNPVFVFSKPGPLADDLTARGFSVRQVRREGLLRLGTIRQVQAIIRQHGIAIVHVNSAVPFSKYVAIAARLSGIPVVWHIREPVEDKRMARQRRWIQWLANIIVVLTSQQADFFNAPHKTRRVFNGVDLAHFRRQTDRTEAKSALGYAADEFLFIQVGSIERNKGQSRSVQAFAHILREQPRCRLLIVGAVVEPEEANTVAAMLDADPVLKAAVRMYGATTDVRPIVWAADCLLLPSLRESFPRTIMEAMASGVPVIASMVGAIGDMVENGSTGLLVTPDNVEELSTSMRVMISTDDTAKKRMSLNCEESAARLFSMDSHVSTIASIYDRLLLPVAA